MLPMQRHRGKLLKDENASIDAYGTSFNIVTYNGVTACTVCQLDTTYNVSTNTQCSTCSGRYWIPLPVCYTSVGIVKWVTGDELENTKIGGLREGDCRVKAKYSDLTYFENALNNRILFNIDGSSMVVYQILPTILKTSLNVLMKKSDPQDEVAIK
jgi:hypothetical protein